MQKVLKTTMESNRVVSCSSCLNLCLLSLCQIHSSFPLLLGDPVLIPTLAGSANPLDQIILPGMALQRPLVAPASPLDDLRVGSLRHLPFLRHGHGPAALLRGEPVGRAVGLALRPAGGLREGPLRLLAEKQPGHALHVPLRCPLYGRSTSGQVFRHLDYEQEQLGDLWKEENGR